MERAPLSFATLFYRRMQEEKALVEKSLADGGCRDISDYRERVGKLNGLRTAEREFGELMKKFGEEE